MCQPSCSAGTYSKIKAVSMASSTRTVFAKTAKSTSTLTAMHALTGSRAMFAQMDTLLTTDSALIARIVSVNSVRNARQAVAQIVAKNSSSAMANALTVDLSKDARMKHAREQGALSVKTDTTWMKEDAIHVVEQSQAV